MSPASPPDDGAPEGRLSAPDMPGAGEDAERTELESQEDFVHESVELPDWVPVAFGLILITIAAAAIVVAR
ncbi:MAG: hypothetical protein KY432_00960 [Acidobacteria bacterium]|nr:hypothetical protein [Acidobacteriota bacterium]